MRPSSRELRDLLAEASAAPGAEPQPGFTLLLEHRLRGLDQSETGLVALPAPAPPPRHSVIRRQRSPAIRPVHGRALRPSLLLAGIVAIVVVASLSLRGGAPGGQLRTTHPGPPFPGAGIQPAPDRTAVVTPSPTSSPPTGPGTSVQPIVPPPAAPARPATTAKSSTSTTDSYSPQSIRLTCGAGAVNGQSTASCKWSASTASDFARYVVLRSGDGKGRVVFTTQDRGATSYIDTTLVRGTAYTFVVDALRSDGSVLAHSNAVAVSCCP